jgi:hypothetical protein
MDSTNNCQPEEECVSTPPSKSKLSVVAKDSPKKRMSNRLLGAGFSVELDPKLAFDDSGRVEVPKVAVKDTPLKDKPSAIEKRNSRAGLASVNRVGVAASRKAVPVVAAIAPVSKAADESAEQVSSRSSSSEAPGTLLDKSSVRASCVETTADQLSSRLFESPQENKPFPQDAHPTQEAIIKKAGASEVPSTAAVAVSAASQADEAAGPVIEVQVGTPQEMQQQDKVCEAPQELAGAAAAFSKEPHSARSSIEVRIDGGQEHQTRRWVPEFTEYRVALKLQDDDLPAEISHVCTSIHYPYMEEMPGSDAVVPEVLMVPHLRKRDKVKAFFCRALLCSM